MCREDAVAGMEGVRPRQAGVEQRRAVAQRNPASCGFKLRKAGKTDRPARGKQTQEHRKLSSGPHVEEVLPVQPRGDICGPN